MSQFCSLSVVLVQAALAPLAARRLATSLAFLIASAPFHAWALRGWGVVLDSSRSIVIEGPYLPPEIYFIGRLIKKANDTNSKSSEIS